MRIALSIATLVLVCSCVTAQPAATLNPVPVEPIFSGLEGAEIIREVPGGSLIDPATKGLSVITSRGTDAQLRAMAECAAEGNKQFRQDRTIFMLMFPPAILLEPWGRNIDKGATNFATPAAWAGLASNVLKERFREVNVAANFPAALGDASTDVVGVLDVAVGPCSYGQPSQMRFRMAFIDKDLNMQCLMDETVTVGEAYKTSGMSPLTATSSGFLRGYTQEFGRRLNSCAPL